jgi:cold shock protein
MRGCIVRVPRQYTMVLDNRSSGIEGQVMRRYQSLIANLEISTMARGTVKWFNSQKGYGSIQPTGGGGRDIFVHISAVERAGLRSLNEGQQIEFEIEENRGKTSAVNLRVT